MFKDIYLYKCLFINIYKLFVGVDAHIDPIKLIHIKESLKTATPIDKFYINLFAGQDGT